MGTTRDSNPSGSPPHTRALVLYPANPQHDVNVQARLEEAIGLAAAINLDVVHAESITLRLPRPATLLGQGTIDVLAGLVVSFEVGLVYIDSSLTPVQHRNLEKKLSCKVIDRTGLILEIFGARARTAEGRLQVELAALTYQRSRLVRTWTHLERQRGGLGFIGGPGETQLEVDRRLITNRMNKIRRELETVKRTRTLHRKARQKVPWPIVALVGYTNAGKSTLFNRLTSAQVMAKDMLFATLDPTMRSVRLPSGRMIILSDTVGFISDLPTQLVAAFRATLEEVLEADLILHVRDVSHPETNFQAREVCKILGSLGLEAVAEDGMIEVLNKSDLLENPEHLPETLATDYVKISALTGEGLTQLLSRIDERLSSGHHMATFHVPVHDGPAIAWLHAHGDVRKECFLSETQPDDLVMEVCLSLPDLEKFSSRFGYVPINRGVMASIEDDRPVQA